MARSRPVRENEPGCACHPLAFKMVYTSTGDEHLMEETHFAACCSSNVSTLPDNTPSADRVGMKQ